MKRPAEAGRTEVRDGAREFFTGRFFDGNEPGKISTAAPGVGLPAGKPL